MEHKCVKCLEKYEITRGTTPLIPFEAKDFFDEDVDLSQVRVIWMTFEQEHIQITKRFPDVLIDGSLIRVKLSQENTLNLKEGNVEVQFRALLGNDAISSSIAVIKVLRILKEGLLHE